MWTKDLNDSYERWKRLLSHAVLYSHRKKGWCVATVSDASLYAWGSAIIQYPPGQEDKPLHEIEGIELLAVDNGVFSNAAYRWSTCDKEAYAVMQPFMKHPEIVKTGDKDAIQIFTDHKNLKYIFDGESDGHVAGSQAKMRLRRWAMELSCFNFNIKHTAGINNQFADYLSRGALNSKVKAFAYTYQDQEESKPLPTKIPIPVHLIEAHEKELAEIAAEEMDSTITGMPTRDSNPYPNRATIFACQQSSLNSMRQDQPRRFRLFKRCTKEDEQGLICDKNTSKIWLPANATKLRQQLLAIAHAGGYHGHRNQEQTAKAVTDRFYSEDIFDLESFSKEFAEKCIFCMKSDARQFIPRQYGQHLQPQAPNEVITWDYFDTGIEADNGMKYLLVIKDRLTGFCMLFPCGSEDAWTAAQCLLEWIGIWGPPTVLLGDNGSHFTANVIKETCENTGTEQMFVTAHCPFSNGAIEAVNRQIKKLLRILMAEGRHDQGDWPNLVMTIQALINQRPTERLKGKAPIEVMTGQERSEVLDRIPLKSLGKKVKFVNLPTNQACVLEHLDKLTLHLNEAYKIASSTQEARIVSNQRRRALKVKHLELEEGDLVLVAIPNSQRHRGHKLTNIWQGPFIVESLKGPLVANISSIVNSDEASFEAHFSRIKKFRKAGAYLWDQWLQQSCYDGANLEIEAILDWRTVKKEHTEKYGDEVHFQIKWVALKEATWELAEAIIDENPAMIHEKMTEWLSRSKVASDKKKDRTMMEDDKPYCRDRTRLQQCLREEFGK